LYNPNNKKVDISRDAKFDEEMAWNWESEKEESYDIFLYFHDEKDKNEISPE